MLITDFQAGELSENLFGRVDAEAYYKGVSRLENFDVIPTGGIKKRAGTRRIAELDAESRLIPFVVAAGNSYVLQLSDGSIRVWKNGSGTGVLWTRAELYEEDKTTLLTLKAKAAAYRSASAAAASSLNGAKADYALKETAANEARSLYEAALAETEAARTAYEAAVDGVEEYREAWESALAAKTAAEAALTEAEAALTEAETALTEAEAALTEAEAALTETEAALTETEAAFTETEAARAAKEAAEADVLSRTSEKEAAAAALDEAAAAVSEAYPAYREARELAGVDALYESMGAKEAASAAALNAWSAAAAALSAASETLDGRQNEYEAAMETIRRSGLAPDDIDAELEPVSPLYAAADIKRVQYTQTENSIILVHPAYPPVMIKHRDGVLSIRKMFFDYSIDDVITDSYSKPELYAAGIFGERFFSGAGNYPACIAFYGSRLVLAGSENKPQTIFVSNAPDDTGSRCARFAMSKRAYSIVQYLKEQDTATAAVRYDWRNPSVLTPVKKGSGSFSALMSQLKYHYSLYCVISYDVDVHAGTRLSGLNASALSLSSGALNAGVPSDADLLEEYKKWAWEYEEIQMEIQIGEYLLNIAGTRQNLRIAQINTGWKIVAPVFESYSALYNTTRSEYTAKLRNVVWPALAGEAERIAGALWDEIHNAREGKKFVYEGVETAGDTWSEITAGIKDRDGVGVKEFQLLLSLWANPNVPEYEYKRENEQKVISADDAFNFELASDTSDEVRWLANNRALIAGTQAAEWYLPPGINALNIQAQQRSRNGNDRIQCVSTAEILAFVQSGRRKIKTYYVPPMEEGYRTGDISALNPEITGESPVKYMDFSATPLSRLFVVREDGVMAVCLTESGKCAWSRYILGKGRIESVSVTPGVTGEDEVYLAAEIDGRRWLLVMDENIHCDNYYSGDGDAFRSLVKSMPVTAGDPYGKKRITSVALRLKDSSLPDIVTDGTREVITGINEPYSGIVKRPVPSGWDRDVFFEIEHAKKAPCVILAVNAEAG